MPDRSSPSNRERCSRLATSAALIALSLSMAGCAPGHRGSNEPGSSAFNPVPRIFLEPAPRGPLPPGVTLRKVSEKGLELTARMEGFQGRLYEDPAGYCTIGYGHLIRMGPCDGSEPEEFRRGIGREQALELLRRDIALAERAVIDLAQVELDDGQYAALCDFTYNVGRGALARSTLLRHVKAGQHPEVPGQFRRFVLANGRKLAGLVARREEEIALFFENGVVPRAAPEMGEELGLIDIIRDWEHPARKMIIRGTHFAIHGAAPSTRRLVSVSPARPGRAQLNRPAAAR